MKKNSVSSIMKGVGVAMAIGSATALVGSAVASKNSGMKKYVEKALKSIEKMM
ncbi:MAG: hypothetical protein IJS17_00210 [Clostridia bacterium]|nr:hypothetical protein [Clostridia bacterium]